LTGARPKDPHIRKPSPKIPAARLRLPWRLGFLERRVESRLPRLRIKTFRNIAATERSASRLRQTTGDSIAATDIPIRTMVLPGGLVWLISLSITAEPTRSPPLLAAFELSSRQRVEHHSPRPPRRFARFVNSGSFQA